MPVSLGGNDFYSRVNLTIVMRPSLFTSLSQQQEFFAVDKLVIYL
jgi:hypothetical protein